MRWHATTAARDPATSQGATALFGNLGKDQAQRVDRLVAGVDAGGSGPTLYFLPVTKAALWPEARTRLNHERHLVQLAYTDRLPGELGRLRAVVSQVAEVRDVTSRGPVIHQLKPGSGRLG